MSAHKNLRRVLFKCSTISRICEYLADLVQQGQFHKDICHLIIFKKHCQVEVQKEYFWTSFETILKLTSNCSDYHKEVVISIQ